MGEEEGKAGAHTSQRDLDGVGRRSVTTRLLNSTSGLLHNSLSSTDSQSAGFLANFLRSEGKQSSSSSSSTASASLQDARKSLDIRHLSSASAGDSHSFREASLANQGQRTTLGGHTEGFSLDQFLRDTPDQDGVPGFQKTTFSSSIQEGIPLNETHSEPHANSNGMSAAWTSVAKSNSVQQSASSRAYGASQVSEADGAEVVKLLRDPTFSLDTELAEENNIPMRISEEDMAVAEQLVRLLRKAVTPQQTAPFNTAAMRQDDVPPRVSSFFDQVQDYAEEVWGYIKPLVVEAKREGQFRATSSVGDGPATRRLRMIYEHVAASR